METAELIKDTIPIDVLRAYFEGSTSPYSERKKYNPKKNPEDELIENRK